MDGGNRRALAARVVAACAAAGVMAARAPATTEGAPGPATGLPMQAVTAWRPSASIEPGDPSEWAIGSAVAIHGDMLAVGPARDWDIGEDRGGVRLFRRSGEAWREAGALMHPSLDVHANFGAALAMSDMHLAVGSPRDGTDGFESGAVFMFRRQGPGWIAEGTLARPDASTSDLMGSSVAISGDALVVGCPKADVGALDTGCVEVFRRVDGVWRHEATLTAPEPQIGALFGLSVAIDGPVLLVGAPGDAAQGSAAGRVHLFVRDAEAWRWDGSIGCPAGARSWFGASVAACRGLLVAGAPRATRPDARGFVRGAAWILEHGESGWAAGDMLVPSDPATGDAIGCAAATDGTTVVLGATADDQRGPLVGCGFAFDRRGGAWSVQRLDPPQVTESSLVGHGVAVDGPWIALGRLGNPEETPGPGRVDLFRAVTRRVDLSGPRAAWTDARNPPGDQAGSAP